MDFHGFSIFLDGFNVKLTELILLQCAKPSKYVGSIYF